MQIKEVNNGPPLALLAVYDRNNGTLVFPTGLVDYPTVAIVQGIAVRSIYTLEEWLNRECDEDKLGIYAGMSIQIDF